jgi:tetratricopeptide (TPR) repeat protein
VDQTDEVEEEARRWLERVIRTPFPSYHTPLDLARTMGRSRDHDEQDRAVRLLDGLAGRYPHVLAIEQERIFVLMAMGHPDRAEAELKRAEKEFPLLDEEFLCRWGRLFKDRGDAHAALVGSSGGQVDPALAERYYRKSLEKYDRAYEIRKGHYPGINKATLLLILGTLGPRPRDEIERVEDRESFDLAGRILEGSGRWRSEQPDDDAVWFPATIGEAHLLRREWRAAGESYRRALDARAVTGHARDTMRRQVVRILHCFEKLGLTPDHPFDDLGSLFSPIPAPADRAS